MRRPAGLNASLSKRERTHDPNPDAWMEVEEIGTTVSRGQEREVVSIDSGEVVGGSRHEVSGKTIGRGNTRRNALLDAVSMKDKMSMRKAILLSEILGPCKGNQ